MSFDEIKIVFLIGAQLVEISFYFSNYENIERESSDYGQYHFKKIK